MLLSVNLPSSLQPNRNCWQGAKGTGSKIWKAFKYHFSNYKWKILFIVENWKTEIICVHYRTFSSNRQSQLQPCLFLHFLWNMQFHEKIGIILKDSFTDIFHGFCILAFCWKGFFLCRAMKFKSTWNNFFSLEKQAHLLQCRSWLI